MKSLFSCKEYAARIVSYLCFSRQCVICQSPSVYLPLCDSCCSQLTDELLRSLQHPRCTQCGRLLLSEQKVCTECRKEQSVFSLQHAATSGMTAVFPGFPYLGKKKRLLTTWKITGDRSLSFLYAQWIYKILCQKFPGVAVVPIPPRKNKMKEKGWDQIEELCCILEKKYAVQVLRILERTTVIQQKKLRREERLGKQGADYKPVSEKKINRILKGNSMPAEVVLLDDVITTGATVCRGAEALRTVGVTEIHPVSLFYVP